MCNLYIDKDEVLRYLGYRGQTLDKNTKVLIDECVIETQSLMKERFVYKIFELKRYAEFIELKGSSLKFEGQDILRHLENSDSCALLAATLGSAVDMRIRYYEKANMTKALIMDACATTAVEEVCDRLCESIEEKLKAEGKRLTSRFSPGYGDLKLSIQREFISVIEADRTIGLTVSAHSILIPRKSVTAVAGIIDENRKVESKGCLSCSKYSECEFKRRNGCCGA